MPERRDSPSLLAPGYERWRSMQSTTIRPSDIQLKNNHLNWEGCLKGLPFIPSQQKIHENLRGTRIVRRIRIEIRLYYKFASHPKER